METQIHDGLLTIYTALDYLSVYAIAVNEENACGGRVVTAPTNGAAGTIPSVLKYYIEFISENPERDVMEFLLTTSAIGMLFKRGASISGMWLWYHVQVYYVCDTHDDVVYSCRGGLPRWSRCCLFYGSCWLHSCDGRHSGSGRKCSRDWHGKIENGDTVCNTRYLETTESKGWLYTCVSTTQEHNLGLTCDPIAGLVQVPCIERNALAAVKAIAAAQLALNGEGDHRVSLDQVIETMRQTGLDMMSKYKETSQGGLAVNVPVC